MSSFNAYTTFQAHPRITYAQVIFPDPLPLLHPVHFVDPHACIQISLPSTLFGASVNRARNRKRDFAPSILPFLPLDLCPWKGR